MLFFQCATNPKHVEKVNASLADLHELVRIFIEGNIPTKWTKESVSEAAGDGKDLNRNHDIFHNLIADLIAAWKAGHPTLICELMNPIMLEVEQKQIQCADGTEHD